ncbi:MAG: hypothetical protein V1872_09610 [bacterium]
MKKSDNYPIYIPFMRSILNLSLFGSGLLLLFWVHIYIALAYLFYCLLAAIILLPRFRCTVCAHYGTLCSTGFGKVAAFLFKKNKQLPFTYGLWYNLFLLPIAIIPVISSLVLIINGSYSGLSCYFVMFYMSLFLIFFEHGYFGCLRCKELRYCPANFIVKRFGLPKCIK